MEEEVLDCRLEPGMGIDRLLDCYDRIHGFMAGHLAAAASLLEEALADSEVRIITFTGNLVATGLRGILAQLLEEGLFNVVFTTAGAIDHDIARHEGGRYLKGFFEADDSGLLESGIHRLGNVFIPVDSYGPRVEGFVRRLASEASKRKGVWGVFELLELAGRMMEGDGNSILAAAAKSGARIFVPGWADGAFGTALFMERQRGVGITVDYFRDMKELCDIFFSERGKAAALIVGGGISKHHAIWWSQFRGGLDYVVYVTTAVEYDGSLSGAHPREAVSWGKVKAGSRRTVVYGDATIVLPVLSYKLLYGRM